MKSSKGFEVIYCTLFVLSVISMCIARPQQSINDLSPQAVGSGTGGGRLTESAAVRNLIDSDDDLTALKMQLLAQQLAEYNAVPQLPDYAADRFVLSKRQQRFRQCYFNPISCFRK